LLSLLARTPPSSPAALPTHVILCRDLTTWPDWVTNFIFNPYIVIYTLSLVAYLVFCEYSTMCTVPGFAACRPYPLIPLAIYNVASPLLQQQLPQVSYFRPSIRGPRGAQWSQMSICSRSRWIEWGARYISMTVRLSIHSRPSQVHIVSSWSGVVYIILLPQRSRTESSRVSVLRSRRNIASLKSLTPFRRTTVRSLALNPR
jgi:hypothetical protein